MNKKRLPHPEKTNIFKLPLGLLPADDNRTVPETAAIVPDANARILT